MSELVRDWKAEKKDLEEAFDIIADKLVKADAEIERLNANIIWLEARNKALTEMRLEDKKLITELCDALEFYVPFSLEPHYRELLQRARAANGWRFFAVAEKDAIIATMNEAHKLLIAEKDAEIDAFKQAHATENRLTQDLVCYRADVVNRDAEITRLNTVIGILEAAAKRDVSLITELCDALEIHSSTYPGAPIEKLIQQGRKATR